MYRFSFLIIFFPTICFAEIYSGNVDYTTQKGIRRTMYFEYNINLDNPNNISGGLNISGHSVCNGAHEIESGSIKNSNLILRTKLRDESNKLCGRIIFNGEVVGDKLVGKVPWGGNILDIELKKK
jgi:hypothetical protein